jgi:hypothetical protein
VYTSLHILPAASQSQVISQFLRPPNLSLIFRRFTYSVHVDAMIVLDDQDHSKKVFSSTNDLDLCTADAILRTPTSTTICLPDYESSQSSYDKPIQKPRQTRSFLCIQWTDKRFWRAALLAFVIYIVISLAVGLPFLIIVSIHHAFS